MSSRDDERCFLISLYGIALDRGDMVSVMSDVIDFFCAAGLAPSHLTVTGRGFGDKPLRFPRAWKRVQKAEAGSIQSLSSACLRDGGDDFAVEWSMLCDIYSSLACFQVGAGLESMPDADRRSLAFIRDSLSRLKPTYGIGFWRTRGRGPSFYGIGLSYGPSGYSGREYEESLAITRWLDGMDEAVYEQGYLRDIYPYNLVSARQLERDVGGLSLRAWIGAGARRGQLRAWPAGLTLWTVPGECVDEVREQLVGSGVLFTRQR